MQVREVAISKVRPYFRNARTAEKAVPKVMASLNEFGWRQPIVVDNEMVIVVGHARWMAAKRLGFKKVPVHVANDLPPEKIRAYRLADNRSHEEADWDNEALKIEIDELTPLLGGDLQTTAFDEKELKRITANGAETIDASAQLKNNKLVYSIVVRCFDEEEQKRLLARLEKEGFACQLLIS
jgi:ParB-like chromosome segregation protein Spo0J